MRKWWQEISSPPTSSVDAWRRGVLVGGLAFGSLGLIAIGAAIIGVPLAVAGVALMMVTYGGASRADKAASKKAKKKAA